MTKVTFNGTYVHRCTDCHGLFLDEFGKEQLRQMTGADAIDTGDAEVGREFNRVDCIQCPACGKEMICLVDADQPRVWFEHCTACGGSFFDAGEFKDLRHPAVVDVFQGFSC